MLLQAIDSALSQTYQNKEVIVVDDGSDSLPELPEGVKVISLDHSGKPSVVRNAGIKAATGDWHFFLDDDDMFYSRHSLKDMLERKKDGTLVFSDTMLKLPNKQRVVEHHYASIKQQKQNFTLPGVYLLEAKLSKQVLFDENMETAEDYERTLRLLEAGAKPVHIPQPHYLYRNHGS